MATGEHGWWKGQMTGSTSQDQGSGNDPKQIVDPNGKPVSSELPKNREELDAYVLGAIRKTSQEYNDFSAAYTKELNSYTEKFLASDLAPYSEMAFGFFKQVQAANPSLPVAQIYNQTVEFVQQQKNAGVKPPAQQPGSRPNGSPIHIPGGSMQFSGDGRFRNDEGADANRLGFYSDERRTQDATDYTNARIRQHEYQKTQGLSGQTMDEYYKELREQRSAASA